MTSATRSTLAHLLRPHTLGATLTLVLAVFAAAGLADEAGAIAKTQALLEQLKLQPEPKEFARVANEVGPVIDEVRQSDASDAELKKLRDLLSAMRKQTEQRLSALEAAAGEDEAALERLYRSQDWDDISFSLAAFPYWRAWMDLEIAQGIKDEGLRTQALLPAMKGFRAASMQLFRPGLVYGGWLGVGYTEMAQGRIDRARQIFQSLEQALSSEADSPIREAVQLELRLLEARSGDVRDVAVKGNIDDNEAKIMRIEAFALLQESRKAGGRPEAAARRLKALIQAGRVDQSLVHDMMTYAQELSSVDIGPWTDLAGAEFALQYDHYYNAMQKYEAFFNNVVVPRGVDLDYYRYRWAVAAYKAEIYQPAIEQLEKLLRKKDLAEETNKAATKLLYAVYAAREASGGSIANRKSLRIAAQRFVQQSPQDRDADSARLMIAQTANNAATALQSLSGIKSANKMNGDVERTAYAIIARDFSDKIARGKRDAAIGTAKQGIAAFQKLPKADKADPFNFAILLQMRALVDPNPTAVLEALDQIEKKGTNNLDIRRALAWSRLQLYDRLGDQAKVAEFIGQLAADGIPSWQMEFLYPWIAERKDTAQRLQLARLVAPALADQPDMDKRVRSLIIEALIETGDDATAYDEARAFTKQHPSSGDAWSLLARTAEAVDKPFEADSAWQVITDKAVPTMAIWWEGMLNRIRIRNNSTRPEESCPLFDEMAKSLDYLPADRKSEYESVRAAARCGTQTAAAAE
ncbi:MAG: hypothetical protein KDC98_19415 [Planctomycetes bacterium]|nr:hypothetical protein [Planctomycetota bacterium]